MSIENTTYAFQNAATTGVGLTQFWLESRFTTFNVTGNGGERIGNVPRTDQHASNRMNRHGPGSSA
jgi:hypothetical protein